MKLRTISPFQNVSPVQSTHFSANRDISGASVSDTGSGGIPLRLHVALTALGALIECANRDFPGKSISSGAVCAGAFQIADDLIAQYNADVEALAKPPSEPEVPSSSIVLTDAEKKKT